MKAGIKLPKVRVLGVLERVNYSRNCGFKNEISKNRWPSLNPISHRWGYFLSSVYKVIRKSIVYTYKGCFPIPMTGLTALPAFGIKGTWFKTWVKLFYLYILRIRVSLENNLQKPCFSTWFEKRFLKKIKDLTHTGLEPGTYLKTVLNFEKL